MEVETGLGSAPVRHFSVFLVNQAGALLSVVRLLQDSGIQVLGCSVQDSIDGAIARLVVSDPESTQTLLIERGIPFNATDVLVLQLEQSAENLQDMLRTLLACETNVHFLYPLLTRPSDKAAMVLHVEDIECAANALSSSGFSILRQSDLSR
jgi:hypothetical protein